MQLGDGTFAEKGDVAGIATLARSRGAALVDLNHDGLLDLAVVNRRAPMEVYQNVSEGTGNWVALTLMGKDANSQAVGAFIEVRVGERVYWREITVGGGHAGGMSAPQYFGLGEAELVEVRIKWPDGTQGDWIEVPVNGSWRVWSEGPVTVLSEY